MIDNLLKLKKGQKDKVRNFSDVLVLLPTLNEAIAIAWNELDVHIIK